MSYKRKPKHKPLSDLQKIAAHGFFDGKSVQEIAAMCGVHRCTVWRWRQRKDFQKEINRITDQYIREKRRATKKAWHDSPEYKQLQRQKYAARKRLKRIEEKMSEAGNSGRMKDYYRLSKEYDRCFAQAYCGGMPLTSFLGLFSGNSSHERITSRHKAPKPVKYVIEIV